MAKEKLLRILVVILVSTLSTSRSSVSVACSIQNTELKNAESNIIEMENMTIDNMENIQGIESVAGPKTKLRIFVSSGMPRQLLRLYYSDATRYGAILVFKGLPGGSFKELSHLVMEIVGSEEAGQMQIDDEAFDRFGVTIVPTIVLSREEECFSDRPCNITYDKIAGSIDVRAALEKFASGGDLSIEATKILKRAN